MKPRQILISSSCLPVCLNHDLPDYRITRILNFFREFFHHLDCGLIDRMRRLVIRAEHKPGPVVLGAKCGVGKYLPFLSPGSVFLCSSYITV